MIKAPIIGEIPLVAVGYPLYVLLCVALSLDALRRPGVTERMMGDVARRRARPWLMAASILLAGRRRAGGRGGGLDHHPHAAWANYYIIYGEAAGGDRRVRPGDLAADRRCDGVAGGGDDRVRAVHRQGAAAGRVGAAMEARLVAGGGLRRADGRRGRCGGCGPSMPHCSPLC